MLQPSNCYNGALFLQIHLPGNHELLAMVDTGAVVSTVSKALVSQLGLQVSTGSGVILRMPNSSLISACGKVDIQVSFQNGIHILMPFVIIEDLLTPLILGLDFLAAYACQLDLGTMSMTLMGCNLQLFRSPSPPILSGLDLTLERDQSPDLTSEPVVADLPVTSNDELVDGMDLYRYGRYGDMFKDPTGNESMTQLISKYSNVFAEGNGLGSVVGASHSIVLKSDTRPYKCSPYRVSPPIAEQIRTQVGEMLSQGIIQESKSPWASPVTLVRKKNGEFRFCIDFRTVNGVSLDDAFPLPHIDTILDGLKGSRIFSSLDCASGYWQIPMHEDSRQLTAFCTPDGLYECLRMPFGLKTAPACFQRMMNTLLAPFIGKFIYVYLDDILVFSKDRQEHFEHLELVFKTLRGANIRLKGSKCKFLTNELKFLGYTVSGRGLQPDEEKVEAVHKWPRPTSVRQLRGFLGFLGYLRRFIPNHASIVAPLHELLTKEVAWSWGPRQEEAFLQSKAVLTSSCLLHHPDFSKKFCVETDASAEGLGAVLSQEYEGDFRPVAFASRSLSTAEKNYSVIEKEALALIFAVKKFRAYLFGSHFNIITDHQPLASLDKIKDSYGRIERWRLLLSEYSYTIIYRKGDKNILADELSRQTIAAIIPDRDELGSDLNLNIGEQQKLDDTLRRVLECVSAGNQAGLGEQAAVKPYRRVWSSLVVHEGILCKVNAQPTLGRPVRVPVLPVSLRGQVLKLLHNDYGHQGITKTYNLMRDRFYWPGMRGDCENHCLACEICQTCCAAPQKTPLQTWPRPSKPFERISIDFVKMPETDRGNQKVMVVIDHFTNWTVAVALPDERALTTAMALGNYVFPLYGLPKYILTDRGGNFESTLFKQVGEILGWQHLRTAPYHPQANGKCERINRTLLNMLNKTTNNRPHDWDVVLPWVVYAYNTADHSVTGFSPYFLLFGRSPRLPIDLTLDQTDLRAVNSLHLESMHDYVDDLRTTLKTLKEMTDNAVSSAQHNQSNYFNNRNVVQERSVAPGDRISYTSFNRIAGPLRKLQPQRKVDTVVNTDGTLVRLSGGKEVHINNIRAVRNINSACDYGDTDRPAELRPPSLFEFGEGEVRSRPHTFSRNQVDSVPVDTSADLRESVSAQVTENRRTNRRERRTPNRYGDWVTSLVTFV